MTTSPIQCSKIEAAVAQLDEAIFMYFHERDPLATHTVVAAAYQILFDLYDPGLLERSLREYLDEEDADEVMSGIRAYQNFPKHAKRDPDAILEFDRGATEFLLQESLLIYMGHVDPSPKLTANMTAYENWFTMRHPELATRHPQLRPVAEIVKREGTDKLSRRDFYQQSVEAYRQADGPS